MGCNVSQIFDPEMLELPNDIDPMTAQFFDSYFAYKEYKAYLPDRIGDLQPLTETALQVCKAAYKAIKEAEERLRGSADARLIARTLLYDEAAATVRAEGYALSRKTLAECLANAQAGRGMQRDEAEAAGLDALEGIEELAFHGKGPVSVSDLCSANAVFSRTSSRAELCGSIRERPVFIGENLFTAEFIAPPADEVEDLLEDLLSYVNDADADPIAKAAIAQLQLVTIHPFEDGNGRTSRALSQRVLQDAGLMPGVVLPITEELLADQHSYVDDIDAFRCIDGPSDPNGFVIRFARACEAAACAMGTMHGELESIIRTFRTTPMFVLRRRTRNPLLGMARRAMAGDYDDVTDADFDHIKNQVTMLADALWRKQTTVHPDTLLGRLVIESADEPKLPLYFARFEHLMHDSSDCSKS